MTNIEQIRQIFKEKLQNSEFVIDKTSVKTIEIINASFIADQDSIFGSLNMNYINREISWYESQSLNVNDIHGEVPKIWKQVSDNDGFINSNYGWCIFSNDNYNQYDWVVKELSSNKDSRRAQMIYTRPSMNIDYNFNGRSDFMCCSNTCHLIRNNELISINYYRSNDAIFGYKNDKAWANYVHTKLYNDLQLTHSNLKLGPIYWNASSLHIYETHFHLVK